MAALPGSAHFAIIAVSLSSLLIHNAPDQQSANSLINCRNRTNEKQKMLQQNNELSSLLLQFQSSLASQKMPSTQARQVLAHALIETLQNWCMQLFWMTVLCVINCCGEEDDKKMSKKQQERPELKKRIEEIEQKMLRHLTSPMISGPLRPVRKLSSRRVFYSRPPSPQLFDIAEEE